jgi:enamine deaminase RidA (YjgF/YER057c/UK114 family)
VSTPFDRLHSLGLELPTPASPAYNYVPVTVHNDVMFVSGQVPKDASGEVTITGTLGVDVEVDEARQAAQTCILQGLAVAAAHLGDFDRIQRVLRVTGYVASAANFHEQPRVVDAASDLLVNIFGDNGRHARSAVGVASLPKQVPVEIELILAVRI